MDIYKAHKNRKAHAVARREHVAMQRPRHPRPLPQQAQTQKGISAVFLEVFLGEDDELAGALWTLAGAVSGVLAVVVFSIWALS